MKLLVIDNYDSFTWNLVFLVRKLGFDQNMEVIRNDKFSLEYVDQFDKILLSPGPGIPSEAGLMLDVIRKYHKTKSILGICLGHQGIGEVFGAKLFNLPNVLHGIQGNANIIAPNSKLFENVPNGFAIAHYHSWVVDRKDLPSCIEITAESSDHLIMGLRHKEYNIEGLQFHPESILTEYGELIMNNWLKE